MFKALLIGAGVASAGPAEELLRGIVPAMVAEVEAAAGREFRAVPKVVVDGQHELNDIIMRELSAAYIAQGDPPERARNLARQHAHHGSKSMAARYLGASHTIYVNLDLAKKYVHNEATGATGGRPEIACLLAHELTHGLVREQLGGPRNTAQRDLREGHAELIAARFCEGRYPDRGAADPHRRASVAWMLNPDNQDPAWAMRYGWSRLGIQAIEAQEGGDAVWSLLAQVKPDVGQVVARGQAATMGPWSDGDNISAPAEALLRGEGWTASQWVVPLPDLLAYTQRRSVPYHLDGTDPTKWTRSTRLQAAAAGTLWRKGKGSVYVAVYKMHTPTSAARVLGQRIHRAASQGGEAIQVSADSSVAGGGMGFSLGTLKARWNEDETWLRTEREVWAERATEHWYVRGDLVIFVHTMATKLREKDLEVVLGWIEERATAADRDG